MTTGKTTSAKRLLQKPNDVFMPGEADTRHRPRFLQAQVVRETAPPYAAEPIKRETRLWARRQYDVWCVSVHAQWRPQSGRGRPFRPATKICGWLPQALHVHTGA